MVNGDATLNSVASPFAIWFTTAVHYHLIHNHRSPSALNGVRDGDCSLCFNAKAFYAGIYHMTPPRHIRNGSYAIKRTCISVPDNATSKYRCQAFARRVLCWTVAFKFHLSLIGSYEPLIELFIIKEFFPEETSDMLKQAHRSHLDQFFECAIGYFDLHG